MEVSADNEAERIGEKGQPYICIKARNCSGYSETFQSDTLETSALSQILNGTNSSPTVHIEAYGVKGATVVRQLAASHLSQNITSLVIRQSSLHQSDFQFISESGRFNNLEFLDVNNDLMPESLTTPGDNYVDWAFFKLVKKGALPKLTTINADNALDNECFDWVSYGFILSVGERTLSIFGQSRSSYYRKFIRDVTYFRKPA